MPNSEEHITPCFWNTFFKEHCPDNSTTVRDLTNSNNPNNAIYKRCLACQGIPNPNLPKCRYTPEI